MKRARADKTPIFTAAMTALAAGLVFANTAKADWNLVDTFQYDLGNVIDIESPWTAHGNTSTVTVFEENDTRFLGFGWAGGLRAGSRPLPGATTIGPGETATFYLQFRASSDGIDDAHFGLASDPDTTVNAPFEAYRIQTAIRPSETEGERTLEVRDGDEFRAVAGVETGTRYNLWYVIDRNDDTFRLYLTPGNQEGTEADRLSDGDADTFALREDVSPDAPVDHVLVVGGADPSRSMHVDEMWMDATGENLTLPDAFPWRTGMPFDIDFGSVRFLRILEDQTGAQHELGVAEEGAPPFVDREDTIVSLPSELEGKLAIRTANAQAQWLFEEEEEEIVWRFVNAVPDHDSDGNPLEGANTTIADGSGEFQPLPDQGRAEDWTHRDFTNDRILHSLGPDGSTPPDTNELVTTVRDLEPGATVPVAPVFHGNWGIRAGLEYGNDNHENTWFDADHPAILEMAEVPWMDPEPETGGRPLMLAFVGNVVADDNGEIDVFIHDFPSGSASLRTWYDGVAVGSEPLRGSGIYLAFEVAGNATVYIANDPSSEPGWLTADYVKTEMTIETTAGDFEVWERQVAAREQVMLPGNAGGEDANNYWVILSEGPEALAEAPDADFGRLPPEDWRLQRFHWETTTGVDADLHTASMVSQVTNFDPANGFRLTATVRIPRLQNTGGNAYGLSVLGDGNASLRAEWLPREADGASTIRLVDTAGGGVLAQEPWDGLVPTRVNNAAGLADGSEDLFQSGSAYFAGDTFFADDFEDAAASKEDWSTGGENDRWEVGEPTTGPEEAVSGDNVFATGLGESFQEDTDAWLRSPVIDLSDADAVRLMFWDFHDLDDDIDFHYATVSVLDAADPDVVIEELARTAGRTDDWRFREFTLSEDSLGREVIIEFRVVTDDFTEVEGWYLDDVEVRREAGFEITSIPEKLDSKGRLYGIATELEGLADTSEAHLEFTVVDNAPDDGNDGVTVYVAWDSRNSGLEPDWLTQNFERTDHFVGVSSEAGFHRLWAREYAGGEQVTLGGGSAAGGGPFPAGTHNYFVLLGDARPGLEDFYTLEAAGVREGDNDEAEWSLTFTLTDADGNAASLETSTTENLTGRDVFGISVRHPDADDDFEAIAPLWETSALSMNTFALPDLITFDQWRQEHFTQEEIDAGLAEPGVAAAGDGVANLLKYAFALPPRVPFAAGDLPQVDVDEDGRLILVFRERTDVGDIEYRPEVSEGLELWEGGPGNVTELSREPVGANLEEVTVRGELPEGAPKGFIRLSVEQK